MTVISFIIAIWGNCVTNGYFNCKIKTSTPDALNNPVYVTKSCVCIALQQTNKVYYKTI